VPPLTFQAFWQIASCRAIATGLGGRQKWGWLENGAKTREKSFIYRQKLWRSQQNEQKSTCQRLELAHPSKEPLCDKNGNCGIGSPDKQSAPEASVPPDPLAESKGTVEPDGRGRVGAILILLESVDRRGRSSASLPDRTILVGSSRQPFLDAARALIAAGHDPGATLEGWRPGATAFALRARLGTAALLTVDETRTVFAPWKPFSPTC
jgi:hypothetical protein